MNFASTNGFVSSLREDIAVENSDVEDAMDNWPAKLDPRNEGQLQDVLKELGVTEERLLRAVASVGTDMRPICAYISREDLEFGPRSNEIAATGRRSVAAEALATEWRARRRMDTD